MARVLPTVDQIDRGLVLCVAGARAHLVVVAATAGMPELTAASISAAAGVRAPTVWAVRGTGGAVDGRVRLAGVR